MIVSRNTEYNIWNIINGLTKLFGGRFVIVCDNSDANVSWWKKVSFSGKFYNVKKGLIGIKKDN
jgi:hypothetical protein